MPPINRLTPAPETIAELTPEIRTSYMNPRLSMPGLNQVLANFSPLPHSALFLGIANDGLPVLLNLRDPIPGPILIGGDTDSGKTAFLQTIARGVDQTHDPEHVRYTVITENTREWEGLDLARNCEGVLSFNQPLTTNYLLSMVDWAHANRGQGQFVLILVDGLDALVKDHDIHQAFRWLLLRGPSRHIWPIVTLKASETDHIRRWLESFRTRLCGHIEDPAMAAAITGVNDSHIHGTLTRSQFAMQEGKSWLPFWLPNLD